MSDAANPGERTVGVVNQEVDSKCATVAAGSARFFSIFLLPRQHSAKMDGSAENTLSVRPDRQYDPHYRYRMPPLDSAADNRNKQRKTRLHNAAAVARNIFRPEAWLVKFMALELSTDSSSSAGAAYLTGYHACRKQGWHKASASCPSGARERASGCPTPRPASANPPLGRLRKAIPALLSA